VPGGGSDDAIRTTCDMAAFGKNKELGGQEKTDSESRKGKVGGGAQKGATMRQRIHEKWGGKAEGREDRNAKFCLRPGNSLEKKPHGTKRDVKALCLPYKEADMKTTVEKKRGIGS